MEFWKIYLISAVCLSMVMAMSRKWLTTFADLYLSEEIRTRIRKRYWRLVVLLPIFWLPAILWALFKALTDDED